MANPSPASSAPSNGTKVLLCTIAFRDRLLDHALAVAKTLGYDGVEIWGREPHIAEKFDETRIRAAKKLLDATGVVPYVLGSYLRFGATKPETTVPLTDVLHCARWLKTPLVRVWASDVPSAGAKAEVWERAVREAQEACDAAAKLGLVLVVEMHDGTLADTTVGALDFVYRVGRDNLKLNFQVATHEDGQTPEQRLEAVLPLVAHVHAQNYERTCGHTTDLPRRSSLAAGVVNYRRLLRMLKEAGYEGAVAVEFAYDEHGDKQKAIAEDLKFLRTLCAG